MTRFLRAIRLGLALLKLEALERSGAAVCLSSSWCAAPGSGFWCALIRPAGWTGAGKPPALGVPVVGYDLVDVIERAVEATR